MNASEPMPAPRADPWTCPFCPLLCDRFSVDVDPTGLSLVGSDCPVARTALGRFGSTPPTVSPQVDGEACDLGAALAAAAERLRHARQPLFGGLGTDVAGARALYPLAARLGAICDPAAGAALMHGLRAQQDRGAFTTTLAEVRSRADLIVCIGSLPTLRYPEFFRRCGVDDEGAKQVVVIAPPAERGSEATPGIEFLETSGDLFDAVSRLAVAVAGRQAGGDGTAPFDALAARLHAARYAVLAWDSAALPAHGSLIVEAVFRTVATLNQRSRAAALPLGGSYGGATVNAVFTWLSGLPLRSRAAPGGLEHEPLRFDAARLLADRTVDALLWIASYGHEPPPPATDAPRIVLGHPAFASACGGAGTVFIPVATPGIGTPGHLFRTEGGVLLPLFGVRDDGLPTVADVVARITEELGT